LIEGIEAVEVIGAPDTYPRSNPLLCLTIVEMTLAHFPPQLVASRVPIGLVRMVHDRRRIEVIEDLALQFLAILLGKGGEGYRDHPFRDRFVGREFAHIRDAGT